jgi:N-acyl-D-amino-acid deacylase
MPISRRSFLVAAAAAACAPAIRTSSHRRFDLVLRGGTVFDGTGAPGVEADVGIVGRRVAAVGRALGAGAEEIDARGLAVAPGFVDIHSHADGTLFEDPRAESVIRQGITTVVVGQDGDSPAPQALDDWFAAIDALPSSVNVATMVGLGAVRALVVGDADRAATVAELAEMLFLVERGLDAGACGASSGLEYAPGSFASAAELAALCRPLAPRGLAYATHMRNEDDRLLEAVDEAIATARGAGCALQISHLKTQGRRNWPKVDEVLARVERARAAGLDVAFDRYPYEAYQTTLANLWPAAARDGGTEAFLARLADPEAGPALRAAARAKVEEVLGGWDNVLVASVADERSRAAEGQRLGAWAASLGRDPYDAAVALLAGSRGRVGMVGFAMSDENLARFLAHPLGMACTDGGAWATEGPARRGHPHPRGLGSFPRVLGHFVRERKVLTLAQAVAKLSGMPAARARLVDRGRLAPGKAGDVVVFDPATVADRATYADPFQYPAGIRAVVVNGGVTLRDGQRAPARTGTTLRLAAPPRQALKSRR